MRFEVLLHRGLPRWAEVALMQALCNTFARAFGVKAPRMERVRVAGFGEDSLDEASLDQASLDRPELWAFAEFSAACMEEALRDPACAERCKRRLFACARGLGRRVRMVLAPRPDELGHVVSELYASIGIQVIGSVPGLLVFRRCYFSRRYSPELCAFMSSFDSGFISGMCGGGHLEFDMRITEGAPSCVACFTAKEDMA